MVRKESAQEPVIIVNGDYSLAALDESVCVTNLRIKFTCVGV